jgi:hypothetical protein
MVYKTRMLMDYIHRPVFSTDHDVLETGSVSILRCSRVKPIQLGPVERANLDHRSDDRFYSATST